jgi:hypothetical protein
MWVGSKLKIVRKVANWDECNACHAGCVSDPFFSDRGEVGCLVGVVVGGESEWMRSSLERVRICRAFGEEVLRGVVVELQPKARRT